MKPLTVRQTLLIAGAIVIAIAAAVAVVQAGSEGHVRSTTQPPQMMSIPF